MINDILKFCTYRFCFGSYINLNTKWRCEGKFLTEDHLYCIRKGYAEFTIEGKAYVLEPGKSYLFPTNRYITYRCPEEFSLDWFHFHVRIFDTIDLLDHIDCPYELPISYEGLSGMLYKRLFQLDQSDCSQKELEMPAIIQQLCSPFLAQATVSKESQTFLKLEPALKYIERHLDIPIRVAELAAVCEYEESYFADLFSKTVGLPPAKYIFKRKMEKAKALLAAGFKVDDLRKSLGFYDMSHFSRSFKKFTGMTAKQYKKHAESGVKVPG
ncbi:MAG: AraC family transcriptional regulator [Lentisphaerales bacterium]|nr:AraC family transcriptional regulator [Lentisphaerales bacterium]